MSKSDWQAATLEIVAQTLGITVGHGQCDIAVRSNEIEGVTHETSASHRGLPREEVERKPQFAADFG
jgi:hypothetical protein